MKTKVWIMLIGLLLLLCVGASLFLLLPGEDAAYAEIYSDGRLLYTLDLRIEQTHTVENGSGVNVITVKDGHIAVTQANCPDGYCMQRGFRNSGGQIVCLPNRLVIRFIGEQQIDGIVG